MMGLVQQMQVVNDAGDDRTSLILYTMLLLPWDTMEPIWFNIQMHKLVIMPSWIYNDVEESFQDTSMLK